MEIKKYAKVPKLNTEERKKQTEDIMKFLKKVHPSTILEGFSEGALELRPIKRGSKVYVGSYNCFRFKEKDIKYLNKFLDKLNGEAACIYWSTFIFDNKKECLDSKGKPMVKGKANTQNALYTQVLPMDFDDVTEEEFLQEKSKLQKLGIQTLDVFTGHGFQSLILLKFKCYDLEILKKFTNLMIMKGFKVDSKIIDPARVLRVPSTFNCKGNLTGEDIIATELYHDANERYTKEDIFERLESLPTVVNLEKDEIFDIHKGEIKDEKEIKKEVLTLNSEEKKVKTNEEKTTKTKISKEELNAKVGSIKELYPMINVQEIPYQVQRMLVDTPNGMRNSVLFFLIPYLRNTMRYSKGKIKKIINIWGNRCNYSDNGVCIEDEFERIYSYDFNGKMGQYTTEMANYYGYIDFKLVDRSVCKITNNFFKNFHVLKDGEIRIYLTMALIEASGIDEYYLSDICTFGTISRTTFNDNAKQLLKLDLITKKKSNRRNGEGYRYYINPYYELSLGFTLFPNSLLELMLLKLTDGETRVFSYFKYMVGEEGSVWASQKTLAENLNKTRQGISLITEKLHEKRFITKETYGRGKALKCTYFINR